MKKFITLMLALFTSVAFSFGCVGGEKEDADTLQIAVINKGYGTEWLSKIVDQYQTDTGKKAKIVKDETDASWFRTSLLAGPSTNKVDLYFSIKDNYHNDLLSQGKYATQGLTSDYILEDLSGLFNEKLGDYNSSLKELLPSYYLDAVTFEGKNFSIPWAVGLEGMLYNKKLFEQYSLSIPRTTNEMFEFFDDIKGRNLKVESGPANGNKIYPISFASQNNYTMYAWMTWWAQYEGVEGYENFLKGVDEKGNSTYTIFNQSGRKEALNIISKALSQKNGYYNTEYLGDLFTQSQLKFLNGEAFISFNGDWVEREASKNANANDIKFMKTPIASKIIDKLTSINSEDNLREVIDYIDGTTQTKPDYVSDTDLEALRKARSLSCTEGEAHIAYIPSYSSRKDLAKDFLRYWLSKKAQNIQMLNSFGNVAPLKCDYSQLEGYSKLSDLQKSKFDIWENSTFIGRKYNTPMTYAGGLTIFRNDVWPEKVFSIKDTSSSYKTVDQYVSDELTYYKSKWSEMMRNAGVTQ